MPFHRSALGRFGAELPADHVGQVPTLDDGPFDLAFAHDEPTHDAAGVLTPYGLAWQEHGYPALQARAAAATQTALAVMGRLP